MGTFNGPRRLCWAQNCPLGRGEKPQPGDPAPPTCDMNLCCSTCRVSVFLLSGRRFTASEGGGWMEEAVAGGVGGGGGTFSAVLSFLHSVTEAGDYSDKRDQ